MVGKTNAGGGGKLTTVIAVAYPAGSICTCGGKKAKDTSGYALFNVKPGTYTVESHTSDNRQSKSTSVTVADSDKGKAIDVTLEYELMLYNAGDQCTYVTGGWKKSYNQHGGSTGSGTVSFGASSATITPASYTSTSMATVNKINLANVKTLKVTLDRYDDNSAAVIVHSSKQNPDLNYDAGDYTVYKSIPSGGTSSTSKYSGTVSLDVSSLSGSYYIVIGSRGGDAGNGKIVVYKAWGDPN